jgi:hypothetical protein
MATKEPYKDASYHVLVHLAKRFTEDILEINQSETRIACGSHVFLNRSELNKHSL